MSLIVHAPNIHQGGGRTLLLAVLEAATDRKCTALLDQRLELPTLPPSVRIERVAPTVPARWRAEVRLRQLTRRDDTVLCFGNLPPLRPNQGQVRVFLQNRYLFGERDLRGFSFATRARLRLERLWFARRLDPGSMVVYVQTQSMATELLRETGIAARVFPFAPGDPSPPARQAVPECDFIYVASGEPHKNHRHLIEAWKLLATEGLFPSLRLTIDPASHPLLVNELEASVQAHRLQITNLGTVPGHAIAEQYRRARALIFPSTLESFGLPLVEASRLGLPILAAELDYVRDVVSPAATFDARSPLSIARAVKRFLGRDEPPREVLSGADFLREIEHILEQAR